MELRVTCVDEHPFEEGVEAPTSSGHRQRNLSTTDKDDIRSGPHPNPNLEMSTSQKVVSLKRYVPNLGDSATDLEDIFLNTHRSIRRHRGFRH